MSDRRPLAVTMGEPAGIGGELSLMAWLRRAEGALPTFAVLDDPDRLRRLAADIGLDVPVQPVAEFADANAAFANALPVLPIPLEATVKPGAPDPANGPAVLASIERAVALARSGEAAGLVTQPIHKGVLYAAGFRHPGHTEYLAELAGGNPTPIMMLAIEGLRVVPVTIHVSLKRAIETLTTDAIVTAGRITATALARDFGVGKPRLAISGLNPHAGEGGAMGEEEAAVITPAIDRLRAEGLEVSGPLPADSMFHARARAGYDSAICMYHDQALIPLKAIDFDNGVNVTLGLPFVRSSPDHGTAFDIAGTGRANPSSFMAALAMASRMATNREAAERDAA